MKTYAIIENNKITNIITADSNFICEGNLSAIPAPKYAKIGDRIHKGQIIKKIRPLTSTKNVGSNDLMPLSNDEIEALLNEIGN